MTWENKLLISAPRHFDRHMLNEHGMIDATKATSKYSIDLKRKIVELETPTIFEHFYSDLKNSWVRHELMRYPFPIVAHTAHQFSMQHDWTLHHKHRLLDASYVDCKGNLYTLFKGVGQAYTESGSEPIIKYRKRERGNQWFFPHPWSWPQLIKFDYLSEGLWLCYNGREYDCSEQFTGMARITSTSHIMVPWPFHQTAPVCAVSVKENELPKEWFEI